MLTAVGSSWTLVLSGSTWVPLIIFPIATVPLNVGTILSPAGQNCTPKFGWTMVFNPTLYTSEGGRLYGMEKAGPSGIERVLL